MPRAFSEQEKELIRKRLVQAGYQLFSSYGLSKTTVRNLSQAAGISKAAFYLFYESKEALFMDVAELAEGYFRRELLATIDLPGPSPRARLLAVFQKTFDLLRRTPVLQFFTSRDYDLLSRRIPAEKLQEHLASDRAFFEDLISRCQKAHITIRVPAEELIHLLYPLAMTAWHGHGADLVQSSYGGEIDLLLELVAAYCLGEVEALAAEQAPSEPNSERGNRS